MTLLILIACLAPAVQAAEPAAIRGTMESVFYEGETVYADGITNLPVGTELNVYVKSLDSGFTWSEQGTVVIYGPSEEDPAWNRWKVYIQPDRWACEKYQMDVTGPGTGASKILQFAIAPASECSQQGGVPAYPEHSGISRFFSLRPPETNGNIKNRFLLSRESAGRFSIPQPHHIPDISENRHHTALI